MFRSFRYRLAPTPEQAERFAQFSGVCRLIYNLAWEQRRDFWRQYKRQTGRRISFPSQCRELTALRAQFKWIAAVERVCQEQALRDLDRAFDNFFNGRCKYPSPRSLRDGTGVRFMAKDVSTRKLNAKWSEVRLPKIGWVKFRNTRELQGMPKNVTLSRDALGWHVSFACEIAADIQATRLPGVGIDRGVANTLALSTGEVFSLPRSMAVIERRKRRAQRAMARKKRGSNRRMKAKRRVARLSAKIARIRKDWHHRTALALAQRFGTAAMESLRVSAMTASAAGTIDAPGKGVRQKAGLNRAILNQGWYAFEAILAYKLEERGGSLVKVPAAYTSQTCSECGVIDAKSRESQAVFGCRHCGFTAHADHNAALNILRRSTSAMRAEGHQSCLSETRTGSGTTAENQAARAA